MTYYWEVAAQVLAADGWRPPRPSAAATAPWRRPAWPRAGAGACSRPERRAAAGGPGLDRGLRRPRVPLPARAPRSVVWHGVHGIGAIVHRPRSPPAGRCRRPRCPAERRPARHAGDRATPGAGRPPSGPRRSGTPSRPAAADYTLYWGDLHRHSLVSRCTAGDEPSLEDFYRYAWDVCEYDFWAVTDHSENSTDYQWWSIQKIADLFRVDGRFVPFYGFEWTSADWGTRT